MKLGKSQIVAMLNSQGDYEKALQAETNLPDRVDTDHDADQLAHLGIDPQALMNKITSTFGDSGAWI